MIDQSTIQRILDAAQIAEVVGEFVSLKRRGVNLTGLCPFHNEKTPSFSVSPAKGIFKCFGCGAGGNSVHFIMEHEHISYPEALKYLAKKYHIEIVEEAERPEEVQQKNDRESMLVVSGFAEKYFHDTLLNSDEGKAIGLSYFKEREIPMNLIEKFKLGYSLEKRNALTEHALKNSYKIEFLEKTGITIVTDDNRHYDRFAGRVMFPIHNLSGKAIAFGGRTLRTDKKVAKYLNSPESEIYHKSNILYGIYQAKNAIVKADKCYMVEGYTDVLSMHRAGIENAVASSGTSLTVEQIRLVRRFTQNLTILYDGDAAGIKASLRGIDLVVEQGLNVKVVLLPPGEDPDSYSKTVGSAEFKTYIDSNETDFISFKTKLLYEEAKTDITLRARLVNEIVLTVSKISDEITRSIYIKECSTILGVDEAALNSKLRSLLTEKGLQTQNIKVYEEKKKLEIPDTAGIDNYTLIEREILRVLINYGDEILSKANPAHKTNAFIINELRQDEMEFYNEFYRNYFNEYAARLDAGEHDIQRYFANHPQAEYSKFTAELLTTDHMLSKMWEKGDFYVPIVEITLDQGVPKLILMYKFEHVKKALKQIEEQLDQIPKNEIDIELIKKQQLFKGILSLLAKNLGGRIIG